MGPQLTLHSPLQILPPAPLASPDPQMEMDFEALLRSNETKKLTSTPDQMIKIEVNKSPARLQAKPASVASDPAILGLLGVRSSTSIPEESDEDGEPAAVAGGARSSDATHWVDFLKTAPPSSGGSTNAAASPPIASPRTPPGPRADPNASLPSPPSSTRSPREKDIAQDRTASEGDLMPLSARYSGSATHLNLDAASKKWAPEDGPGSPQSEDSDVPRSKGRGTSTQLLSDFLRDSGPPPQPPAASSSRKEKPKGGAAMRLLSSLQSKTTRTPRSAAAGNGTEARLSKSRGQQASSSPDLSTRSADRPAQRYTMIKVPGSAQELRRKSVVGSGEVLVVMDNKSSPVRPTKRLPTAPSSPQPMMEPSFNASVRKLMLLDPGFAQLESLIDEIPATTPVETLDGATQINKTEKDSEIAVGKSAGEEALAHSVGTGPEPVVIAATSAGPANTVTQATQTHHTVLVAETEYVFDDSSSEGNEYLDENEEDTPRSVGQFVEAATCAACGEPQAQQTGTTTVLCASLVEDMVAEAAHAAELASRDRSIAEMQSRIDDLSRRLETVIDVSATVVEGLKAKPAPTPLPPLIVHTNERPQLTRIATASASLIAPPRKVSMAPASAPSSTSLSNKTARSSLPTIPFIPPPVPRIPSAYERKPATPTSATSSQPKIITVKAVEAVKTISSPSVTSSSSNSSPKDLLSPTLEVAPIVREDIQAALPEVKEGGSLFDGLFDSLDALDF
ncbi:hypothetical protein HKX48_002088 [Thoreauomyces humboldtii]|nr:hypothetical protein HKX48_002088 [Thoreauomyces humboldtii]